MRGWKGFALGAMGLAFLELVLANRNASQNVGGLAAGAGNLVRKFLSPTVPAFSSTPPAAGISGTAGQGAYAGGIAAMEQLGTSTPSGNPLPITRYGGNL